MTKVRNRKLLICLMVMFSFCFWAASPAIAQQKEKIGVIFLSAGEHETYQFDWVVQYFDLFFDLLPFGFYAGGKLEGGDCYTYIHYADEAESFICGVPLGTAIDAFCNEYTGGYPIHSGLDHMPVAFGGDGGFAIDCIEGDAIFPLSLGHTTIDPVTGAEIIGPHVDDPNASGIGIADIAEAINFDNIPDYYRRPGNILPHRPQLLRWWYGNDAPDMPPISPEPANIKDALVALLPQYELVFRHGWEAFMVNEDVYGNPSQIADSTETAIQELLAAGVERIILAHSYATFANLTQYGHEWYDDNGQGISTIPGKTFKECVEDVTDGVGPKTQADLGTYLTDKPWNKHWQHPFPLTRELVLSQSPGMDLRFAKAYGEPAEFEQALLNTVNYAVEKYSIPQTASLEVILMSHGNAAGYMEAQECDNYLQKTDAFSNRLIAFLESNFTWQGQFEAVHGATEMSEGSSDPPGPGKPFGDRMSVGEQTDSAINGKYVNALGQVVDNGENNFDYIVTVHMLFESESSDTTYRIQQNNLGNNVLMSDEYRRSKLDKDGTEYDAGDVDSEYFTSKIFDATGWPSTPGCLEDSDCALNNPTVYKGSATKPTRIIMSGTVLSLDTGNPTALAARQSLTSAFVNTIADAIQSPEPYGAEDICGQVTGDIQAGVAINISKLTCGTNQALTPVVTDAEGNYCFRNLQTGVYRISDPQGVSCAISCAISPFQYGIIIPQTGPISYNFTATCP